MRILGSVAVALCLVGCLPAIAQADDGTYVGMSKVLSAGDAPQACVARTMLIGVSGQSFSLGKPPVATGTVSADGTFKTRFSSGTGQKAAQFDVGGRIAGPKATGTITGSNGCTLSFDLTKQ